MRSAYCEHKKISRNVCSWYLRWTLIYSLEKLLTVQTVLHQGHQQRTEKILENVMNEKNLLCRKIPIDKTKSERNIQRAGAEAEAFLLFRPLLSQTFVFTNKQKSSSLRKENSVKSKNCVMCGKIVYCHYSGKHVVVSDGAREGKKNKYLLPDSIIIISILSSVCCCWSVSEFTSPM